MSETWKGEAAREITTRLQQSADKATLIDEVMFQAQSGNWKSADKAIEDYVQERLVAAEKRERDLRAALEKYGKHRNNCNFHVWERDIVKTIADCDCGLRAALAKTE